MCQKSGWIPRGHVPVLIREVGQNREAGSGLIVSISLRTIGVKDREYHPPGLSRTLASDKLAPGVVNVCSP